MIGREDVLAQLAEMGVCYEEIAHEAVYTMAEMENEQIDRPVLDHL